MVQTLDIGMGDYRASPGQISASCTRLGRARRHPRLIRVRTALRSPDKCIGILDSAEEEQMTQMVMQMVMNVGNVDKMI